MQVESFLPKYPSIDNTTEIFKMYENENFNSVLFRKKEFHDLKLTDLDIGLVPTERSLMKHQLIIARFLASHTLYDEIFLFHEPGTGKTCSAIGAIEHIFNTGTFFKGAVILVYSPGLMQSFFEQILLCTPGTYEDEQENNNPELSSETIRLRRKKRIARKYKINTHEQFVTHTISKMTDIQLKERFSNMVFVVDEAHHITERLYPAYKRFFSVIDNRKIILMTGTPMIDTPAGIARIMNLILPEELQLPMKVGNSDFFVNEMFDSEQNLTPDAITILQTICTGRISYLRSVSRITTEYQGRVVDPLRKLVVYPSTMGQEQWIAYKTIRLEERFFQDASEASLFVYPNGQFGKTGENLFFKNGKMNQDLKRTLRWNSNPEDILHHIGRYSCKYASAIREIINRDMNNQLQNAFVFSESITGSGAIVFGQLLELFGYKPINSNFTINNKTPKQLQYAILSGNTDVNKIRKIFNHPENAHGKYLQVLIGGRKVSEGFTFKNVQQIHIMQPHWNFSTIDQAIARGVRLNAHSGLPIGTTVRVFLHVALSPEITPPDQIIDLKMYLIAEEKDYMIKQVKRIIQMNSFDCGLTYNQNIVLGTENGTRDCDYGDCLYRCTGLGINEYPILDYSTYNLYYDTNNVEIVLDKLSEIFKTRFFISILEFFTLFNIQNNKDVYQLLSALQQIIELKLPIQNKYGFKCMLFQSDNTLYLDQDVYSYNYQSSYYTENPTLLHTYVFKDILKKVVQESIPNDIRDMVAMNTFEEKITAFRELAPVGQLMFLEIILQTPEELFIGHYKTFVDSILADMNSFIIQTEDVVYITYIPDKIRVLRNNQWEDATENDMNHILSGRFIVTNPYKLFGTIRDDKFSIHDFKAFRLNDTEKIFKTSKNCTSFTINELKAIATRLGIDVINTSKKALCASIQMFLEQKNLIMYKN